MSPYTAASTAAWIVGNIVGTSRIAPWPRAGGEADRRTTVRREMTKNATVVRVAAPPMLDSMELKL